MSHFSPVPNPMSFFSQIYTPQRCGSVETSGKVRIMSHFSPRHEPLVILYLALQFSEVWKRGKVWQSQDVVTLFPIHEPLAILYLVLQFSNNTHTTVWKTRLFTLTDVHVRYFVSPQHIGVSHLYTYKNSDFVRRFHASTSQRSIELSKEWVTGEECDIIRTSIQTIPPFHTSKKCRTWNEKGNLGSSILPHVWQV